MKKNNIFLTLIFSVVSLGLFSSCSSEDDGPITDPASVIAGTYVGHGQLELVGLSAMPLEEFAGMKMVVTKSSNEFVVVTPYLVDGDSFFASGSGHAFQITQSANGDFMLTNAQKPECRLTITASKAMTYYFPYVNVDGDGGYALSFTGSKQ